MTHPITPPPWEAHGYIAWMLFEGDGKLRPEAREVLTARGIIPAARRPKPPSLKEQALQALRHAPGPDYPNPITLLTADEHALIRRALEQLDD
jgi:hypothetical protein